MKVPINYARADTPLPGWGAGFVRARVIFLALYLAGMVGWYWLMFGGRGSPLGIDLPWEFWPVLTMSLILFGGQVLLLFGAPQWRWPKPRRRGAIWVSIAAGGLIGALLTCGILLSLYAQLQLHGVGGRPLDSFDSFGSGTIMLLVVVGVPWIFWTLVFGVFWVGQWVTIFRRMYRVLLAGTWLELAITIPVDVQVRKRTNCYCDYGTFFALIIGLTAIFWTFGPGVVLLFLTRRMQRRAEMGDLS